MEFKMQNVKYVVGFKTEKEEVKNNVKKRTCLRPSAYFCCTKGTDGQPSR